MIAKDTMTKTFAVVQSQTLVEDIARILLERQISAVPVVDANGQLVEVVNEGDLMVRAETTLITKAGGCGG